MYFLNTDCDAFEDPGPQRTDVGVFIEDADLVDWHAKMQVKMPRVFLPDEKVFGKETTQHRYGTKLLAYFDDDKNKPMRATVLGSRWQLEERLPGIPPMCADYREPHYTILIGGQLSQIGLMDAHDIDPDIGWKAVGPYEPSVNPDYDALAQSHGIDTRPRQSEVPTETKQEQKKKSKKKKTDPSTTVCKFWLKGRCNRGDRCRFLHEKERKPSETAMVLHKYINCDNCGKSNPQLRCACEVAYYCNSACKADHLFEHESDCLRTKMICADVAAEKEGANGDEEICEIVGSRSNDGASHMDQCCSICLSEPPVNAFLLDCGHAFCYECLRRYQSHVARDMEREDRRNLCPTCRQPAPHLEKMVIEKALLLSGKANAHSDASKKAILLNSALAELDKVSDTETPHTLIQHLVTKAEIFQKLERHEEAIQIISRVIELQREADEAIRMGDEIFSNMNHYEARGMQEEFELHNELLADLLNKGKMHLKMRPDDVIELYLSLAQCQESLKDHGSALDTYKKLWSLEEVQSTLENSGPSQRKLFMGSSRCYYHLGQYEKAIKIGQAAIEMNKHFPGIHEYVALSQLASGDAESAIATSANAVLYEAPWDKGNKTKTLDLHNKMKSGH